MSGPVHFLADYQSRAVQRRAIAAVNRQREHASQRLSLAQILGGADHDRHGIVAHASLDAWYRAQPVHAGSIAPRLSLSYDEKRMYGLPPSARLLHLRDLGGEADTWSIVLAPVVGGYVVGVKAPDGGGGVGVLWKRSHKASDYALRLSVEHGMPIRERYA